MMSSASATSSTTSRLISGLDSHTPTQHGENGHMEHGWSNDIRERIVQLSFQLVRTSNPSDLGQRLGRILSELWPLGADHDLLDTILRLTAQTRDIEAGKGEWTLAYELLKRWWQMGDARAESLVYKFIYYFVHDLPVEGKTHPFGSWKDVKAIWSYFGGTNCPPRLQDYLVKLVNHQLRLDASSPNPSLLARWIPREGAAKKSANPFKPFVQALAYDYFSNYLETAKSVGARTAARRLACMNYRKLVSSINKKLDTPQIKQCAGEYSSIDFNKVTSVTMRKQNRAFQNKNKKGEQRSSEADRILAAENFAAFVECAKKGEPGATMKGKRVGLNTMVENALTMLGLISTYGATPVATSSLDIDTINLQWKDGAKTIGDLGKMIAMVDTSGSMDGDPLYAALGIGLRIAEKSQLGRRVLTFSANPVWVNLDNCIEFTDMLRQTRHTDWGMNTNFTKALKMILNVIEKNRLSADEVADMTLVVLSDMQIDAGSSESLSESMWSAIHRLYAETGRRVCGKPYTPPHILFWNLRHTSGFPVTSKQKGVTMFSGFSPVLLNSFCEKGMEFLEDVTPWSQLMTLLSNERYNIASFPEPCASILPSV